jgi:hypothetical protein
MLERLPSTYSNTKRCGAGCWTRACRDATAGDRGPDGAGCRGRPRRRDGRAARPGRRDNRSRSRRPRGNRGEPVIQAEMFRVPGVDVATLPDWRLAAAMLWPAICRPGGRPAGPRWRCYDKSRKWLSLVMGSVSD